MFIGESSEKIRQWYVRQIDRLGFVVQVLVKVLIDNQVPFGEGRQAVVLAGSSDAATVAETDIDNLGGDPAGGKVLDYLHGVFFPFGLYVVFVGDFA